MSEDSLQKSVAKLLDLHGLTWFHPPNEGKRNPVAGRLAKEKGLKSGVPDVIIFDNFGEYSGTAIELKVKGRKQTESQIEWECKLRKCRWSYHVCRSIDEVIEVLKTNYNK